MHSSKKRELRPVGPWFDGENDTSDGDGDAPSKIEISQERLDALINDAYKKGAKNSREAQQVQQELQELRAIKQQFEELQAKKDQGGGAEDLEALKQQVREEFQAKLEKAESRAAEAENKTADVTAQFRQKDLERIVVAAAGRLGAKDADDVMALMDRAVNFEYDQDAGTWVIKDAKGRVRLDVDNDMQPLAIDKAVAEFLDTKPHLRRSSGRTGSGPGVDGDAGDGSPEPIGDLSGKTVLKEGPRAVLDRLRGAR